MSRTLHRTLTPALAALLVLVAAATTPAGGPPHTWTCETIANKGSLDPLGGTYGGRFEEPAINGAGDVLFHAKAKGAGRRLYLVAGGGAVSVVATQGDAAPGGSTYTKFGSSASGNAPLSINDAGDLGFFGDLKVGEGVFVKPAGQPIERAAAEGDAVPSGGTIDRIHAVSRVNAAGNIALFAEVAAGTDGIYLYDSTTNVLSTKALVGAVATDGRTICTLFRGLGLSDANEVVLHASTKVSCANAVEDDKFGLYRTAAGSLVRVALEGDATPFPGTTYSKFFGSPELNAAAAILFRARTQGARNVKGLFLQSGGTTTVALEREDVAPGVGGTLRAISTTGGLTDGGRALFRASVIGGSSTQGIFFFDGVDEEVVLVGDAVPLNLPPFGPGSIYRKLDPDTGVSRGGLDVAFTARVLDTTTPRSTAGLFRCEGS